jgi:hypothetical protein
MSHVQIVEVLERLMMIEALPPKKTAVESATGAGRSADTVHVASRRWFSFLLGHKTVLRVRMTNNKQQTTINK